MTRLIGRREWLLSSLAMPGLAAATLPLQRSVRTFRLTETAGLRRFGFPVETMVPDAVDPKNFRLHRDGQPIPAQFRAVEVTPGQREIWLDFNASPGPLESQAYEVVSGPDFEPGPEPSDGLKINERDGRYSVVQSGSMTFDFSKGLAGFLESVGNSRLGYVRGGSNGLRIFNKVAQSDPPTDLRWRVTRQGPLSIALRGETANPSQHRSTLDLTIPQSKTWVQAICRVDDPDNTVEGVELDLNLLIEGSPTLVDFGAGSTVYGRIKDGQRMVLEAGRQLENPDGWVVRHGSGDQPPIFAASTPGTARPAEGWAHVMDQRRCTAVAVADFGKAGRCDRISIEADGRLRLVRNFADRPDERTRGAKVLKFWLHFVPMPVQVGAATSPQSILTPLRVEWSR